MNAIRNLVTKQGFTCCPGAHWKVTLCNLQFGLFQFSISKLQPYKPGPNFTIDIFLCQLQFRLRFFHQFFFSFFISSQIQAMIQPNTETTKWQRALQPKRWRWSRNDWIERGRVKKILRLQVCPTDFYNMSHAHTSYGIMHHHCVKKLMKIEQANSMFHEIWFQ